METGQAVIDPVDERELYVEKDSCSMKPLRVPTREEGIVPGSPVGKMTMSGRESPGNL
jgi:hypothetical protein